ncbi:MAG: hypothetical protein ACK55Z_21135, partial [bacterium]
MEFSGSTFYVSIFASPSKTQSHQFWPSFFDTISYSTRFPSESLSIVHRESSTLIGFKKAASMSGVG